MARTIARVGCGLSLCCLVACAPLSPPDTPTAPATAPLSSAVTALAHQAYAEMLEKYPLYPDPAVQHYVQSVGARLVQVAPRSSVRPTFLVLDSPGTFAYSFPNGEVVIARGLLAYLNSEAQLAAVLAHEVGHLVALHTARQWQDMDRARQLETMLSKHVTTQQARDTVGSLSLARLRGYHREQELEADQWSERLLKAAGYDAAAMAQVLGFFLQQESYWDKCGFELWELPESGDERGVFATHPDTPLRLEKAVQRVGRTRPPAQPDTVYLQALRGLVYGLPERDGVVRGSLYAHPARRLAFTLPAGWYVFGGDNRVVAAPQGHDGLLIMRAKPPADGRTPTQALEEFMRGDSLESIAPHSAPGVSAVFAIVHPKAKEAPTTLRVAVLDVSGQRITALGYTYQAENWNEADAKFLALLRSVRPLSASEAGGLRPLRVQIVTAPAENALTPVIQGFTDHGRERWELLNQLYPQGRITAGQPVKTVR